MVPLPLAPLAVPGRVVPLPVDGVGALLWEPISVPGVCWEAEDSPTGPVVAVPWEPEPDGEGAETEVCWEPPGTVPVEFSPVGTVDPRVPVDPEPEVRDGELPVELPPGAVLFPDIDVPFHPHISKQQSEAKGSTFRKGHLPDGRGVCPPVTPPEVEPSLGGGEGGGGSGSP